MRTLVVLPTYDEAQNVAAVLRLVRAALPDASVLVVDDASPDGTADVAATVGDEVGAVEVLRRPGKGGLGSAYREGFARGIAAGFDMLVEIDADLSHDPAVLPVLVGEVERGADLAIGSRYVPGGGTHDWSWRRRMLSRWGNRYAAALLGLRVRDATSGYRCWSAAALAGLDLAHVRAEGYAFQVEMTWRLARRGGRIVEVPITFTDRRRGASKMSGRIVLEAMLLVTAWGLRDRFARRRGVARRRRPPARSGGHRDPRAPVA